ncbi:MAG: hypothetical protein ACLSE6_00315 [Alphaproteobacteria bacterium]
MLKQIMALLFVLSAAGCSPVLQMTREECREQRKSWERSDYSGGDARLGGLSADPAGADAGIPFGFNHPWTVGEDPQMCYVEVYQLSEALCSALADAEAGAAKVLVNGSMWGICTENARIRWLFTKFPAYSREEYRLDIRKAAQ